LDVETPDGNPLEHHVVRPQSVVLTVVIKNEDRVLMLWRHRCATNEWAWGLAEGILDTGEDPADCAVREVVEETGWRPDHVEHLWREPVDPLSLPHRTRAACEPSSFDRVRARLAVVAQPCQPLLRPSDRQGTAT
jgi:8-oxo-dGTP pyrophosphatase MutT (NUDIX family)